MYFAHNEEKSNSYRIESAALDGSERTIIVNCTELVDSLTIDFPDNRLYFVYKYAGSIFYLDLASNTVNLPLVLALLDPLAGTEFSVLFHLISYNN